MSGWCITIYSSYSYVHDINHYYFTVKTDEVEVNAATEPMSAQPTESSNRK